MAFSLNDKRTPLEQFLQGESVTAYEFMGSHFVNWATETALCSEYGHQTHFPYPL